MTVPPNDPAVFLTTLARWNQPAFFAEVARGPGALAGLKVVPRERNEPRGAPLNEALGDWVAVCWPGVVEALAPWTGAVAQRGGWPLIWAYAPGAGVEALGAALAAAVTQSAPETTPPLVAWLVVVPVTGTGTAAADAATRAAEEELHSWDHGAPAAEYRWSSAPFAERDSAPVGHGSRGGTMANPRPRSPLSGQPTLLPSAEADSAVYGSFAGFAVLMVGFAVAMKLLDSPSWARVVEGIAALSIGGAVAWATWKGVGRLPLWAARTVAAAIVIAIVVAAVVA